jgi:hypothetical protein
MDPGIRKCVSDGGDDRVFKLTGHVAIFAPFRDVSWPRADGPWLGLQQASNAPRGLTTERRPGAARVRAFSAPRARGIEPRVAPLIGGLIASRPYTCVASPLRLPIAWSPRGGLVMPLLGVNSRPAG